MPAFKGPTCVSCGKSVPEFQRLCTECIKLQEDNKPENKIKRLEETVAELKKTVIMNEELLFHIRGAIKEIQANSDIYISTKYIDRYEHPYEE